MIFVYAHSTSPPTPLQRRGAKCKQLLYIVINLPPVNPELNRVAAVQASVATMMNRITNAGNKK